MIKSILILLSCLLASTLNAATIDKNSVDNRLSNISKQIANAQSHLNETLAQQTSLEQILKQSEQSIGELSNKIRDLNSRLDHNNQALGSLTQQALGYEAQLSSQRDAFSQQVRMAYQNNRENYLKVFLNQENPYEFSRIMTYYGYFSRAHLKAIQDLEATLAKLGETQTAIDQSTRQLKQLLDERLAQQAQLEASRQQRKQVLSQLHNKAQTQQQRLTALQADKQALEKVISDLQLQKTQNFTGGDFAKNKGKMSWPTQGKITHHFGSVLNQSLRYSGVFISVPEGQSIQAIAPGKVIFANWLKGFGLLLIIDHGKGYMSLYAHCNSLYKKVGDMVTAGMPIASVGNSGGMEDPGLDFQIRYNSNPINPSLWCK